MDALRKSAEASGKPAPKAKPAKKKKAEAAPRRKAG